jgi:tetratricopeptide (TPR) repeat protein
MQDMEQDLNDRSSAALGEFKKITRDYALFHIFFFSLAFIELAAFLLFFSFFTRSSFLAFALAAFFLTGFSYFVLLFYFQAKKPEQIKQVQRDFLGACTAQLPSNAEPALRHLSLSRALHFLSGYLHRAEYHYYPLFKSFTAISPLIEKFSIWTHWKDLLQMRESLLFVAIKEHVELVKLEPTNLQTHEALGKAYLSLAELYRRSDDSSIWVPPEFSSEEMQQKGRTALEKALEEYRIIDALAPGQIAVYEQMAAIWSELGDPEKEAFAYEAILKVHPQHSEALFKLGVLYFQQSESARALTIYDQLKKAGSPHAEELISHYGAHLPQDL